jgi:hypothetical protein
MRHHVIVAAVFSAMFIAAACGHERSDFFEGDGDAEADCRDNPGDCDGQIGGECNSTDDCFDGVCCRENKNCDGGMCLYRCDDDGDCPSNQRCEHDHCFYECDSDGDCGPGQSCEHGNTICEYP